jgi:hypothetical protein
MCAQALEAARMATKSANSPFFLELLSSYKEAETAFEKICKLNDKTLPAELSNLTSLLAVIRNKGTFHYFDHKDETLAKWLQESLLKRVSSGLKEGPAMISDDDGMTRYAFADDLYGDAFFRRILRADLSSEQALNDAIERNTTMLTDIAMDIRVVGDNLGKELLMRYPID